jgi:hypothetical protein
MKILIDDWHYRSTENDMLVYDVFLSNGQHAVLEVNPMKNSSVPNGEVPEMIVFCEYPGEKVDQDNCTARWIARPPQKQCPWSNVEIPLALVHQIRDRLTQAPLGAH